MVKFYLVRLKPLENRLNHAQFVGIQLVIPKKSAECQQQIEPLGVACWLSGVGFKTNSHQSPGTNHPSDANVANKLACLGLAVNDLLAWRCRMTKTATLDREGVGR